MNSIIRAVEYVLPEGILANADLARIYDGWSSEKIEKKVGIKNRRITGENETAFDLALAVGRKVLSDYDKNNVDFLLLCTESPDYYLPPTSCILQSALGLNTRCGAVDYSLGCSGYVYGLALAKGLIASNIAKNILLITSETYSKHIHPMDRASRTIFGDAASATIIEKSDQDGILEFVLGTDGRGAKNLIVPNGGLRKRFEPNAPETRDENGSLRTANNLHMDGPAIFNFTIDAVPALVQKTLEVNHLSEEQIDYFIFHQANKHMLDHLRKTIGIPEKKFYSNIQETGNTVSSTIPIALKEVRNDATIKTGDLVMLVGFGVGYSWGATIVKVAK